MDFSLDEGLNVSASRRTFLSIAGKGMLAVAALNSLPGLAFAGSKGKLTLPKNPPPVKLPPLDHPSEGKKPAPEANMPPDRRVGFALVGLGHLTLEELLPAFAECKKARPVALVSGDEEKAKNIAAQYGIDPNAIYNYQNFDELKNNPEVEVVYIVLPNSMHHEFTLRAARAGKHVLCEKPMSVSVAEAEEMIDVCAKHGRKLMVAYRIQYEPLNTLAKTYTRKQKFGKARIIEAVNVQNIGDPKQWRLNRRLAGGGALPDIGIYNINTIRFLLGEEPDWVLATTQRTTGDPRFQEVEESVLFQMHFPSGVLANCSTSYGVHNAKRYTVYGDNGGRYGLDPAFTYTGLKMDIAHVEDGKEFRTQPMIEAKNQFALEMDHMADCVLHDKKPYTPGEEGLQDMRIIEAIYRSAESGRKVHLKAPSALDAFRGTPPETKS